ncbi:MAG: GCN5-related N-acetyltransferase [Bacteroidetes bacterium]|nr:GCN5-related N-acetyltransferase [Bacteroidota bacterium]
MIREFEYSDKLDIQRLFEELTDSRISDSDLMNRLDFINNSSIDSLSVYALNNSVIGLLGFRIRENMEENSRYSEISVIVVDSNFQKQGIGKQLLEFAEQLAKDLNCKGTWLVSGFGRKEKKHQFYKSFGYVSTGYEFVKQ